jgi:hypothetical protein
MVDTKTLIQTVADHKGDDDIFAYQGFGRFDGARR